MRPAQWGIRQCSFALTPVTSCCSPACAGKCYCASAARATVLLVANALRVGATSLVGGFLIFLGKLAVAAGAGCAALLLSNLQMFSDPGGWVGEWVGGEWVGGCSSVCLLSWGCCSLVAANDVRGVFDSPP